GMTVDPRTGWLWLADDVGAGAVRLTASAMTGRPLRHLVRARHDLPIDGGGMLAPAAGGGVEGGQPDLLMASGRGRFIPRMRVDRDGGALVEGDRLLEDRVGPIRLVLVGPDGAIYFCTGNALGRLVPLSPGATSDAGAPGDGGFSVARRIQRTSRSPASF